MKEVIRLKANAEGLVEAKKDGKKVTTRTTIKQAWKEFRDSLPKKGEK